MKKEKIISEIKKIINEGWTDGIAACVGSRKEKFTYCSGVYENGLSHAVTEYTLFDLASVSKLFTLIGICSMIQDNIIDINKCVFEYPGLKKYINLQHLHLYELINFSCEIRTPYLVTECQTSQEVNDCLAKAYVYSDQPRYSDIGVMVFVNMIDMLFYKNYFRTQMKNIWEKNHMHNTFWFDEIPHGFLKCVQSYDKEYSIDSNNNLIIKRTPIGIVHDEKCRVVGSAGHSGIFTCLNDIIIFCTNVLDYKIVNKDIINEYVLSTYYDTYTEKNNQHFGILSYKKTENNITSEIPSFASSKSIAMSGYTGCYLLLDFEKKKYVFIGSNKIHNKLNTDKSIGEINLNLKNTKTYVYRKDILRDFLFTEY